MCDAAAVAPRQASHDAHPYRRIAAGFVADLAQLPLAQEQA
jgi:hypothetical protein